MECFSLVPLFDCMAQEQTVKAISLQTQTLLNHRSTEVKEDKCDLPRDSPFHDGHIWLLNSIFLEVDCLKCSFNET